PLSPRPPPSFPTRRSSDLPLRYRHVLYHRRAAEPVDVIVYRQKGFQQAWFLIVPPDSEAWLPTAQVVALYRQRMQIAQCFRDWKDRKSTRLNSSHVSISYA